MRRYSMVLGAVAVALLVSACGRLPEDGLPAHYSNYQAAFDARNDGRSLTDYQIETMLQKVEEDDFAIRLVRFGDHRPPANRMVNVVSDEVIHEYNPDQFLGDVSVWIPHQLQIDWPQPGLARDMVYPVEIDLTHMRLLIKTGTLMTGRFGRYVVELEADYLIRDTEANILEQDRVVFEASYKRKTIDGRRPSAAEDRQAMLTAVRRAVRRLGAEVAWEVKHAGRGERYTPPRF